MDNANPGLLASRKTAASSLMTTLAYHLRSLWLILRSYPTPSIPFRYIGNYLDRISSAIRRTPETRAMEEIRRQFRSTVATCNFTHDWFDNNIPIWSTKLAKLKALNPEAEILEIGSYEGRSTLFLLTYFPKSRITVIDFWGGGEGAVGDSRLSAVESRFDKNLAEHGSRITKLRGRSAEWLGKLSSGESRFDLIYVDGSHYSDDVIIDATLSWSLLRPGGMMIFDDYVWFDYRYGSRKSVCRAVNLFLRLVTGEYRIVHVAHQIIIQKISNVRASGEDGAGLPELLAPKGTRQGVDAPRR